MERIYKRRQNLFISVLTIGLTLLMVLLDCNNLLKVNHVTVVLIIFNFATAITAIMRNDNLLKLVSMTEWALILISIATF